MTDLPLVSVVMPTYGRNDSLFKAIELVRQQSYPYWQIVVVDDNAADSEERRINQRYFAAQPQSDERIIYVTHACNRGACAARNTGVKHASGEIIAFYDDDDSWFADKLERQVGFLRKEQLDYSFCWMNEHYQGYRKRIDFDGEPELYSALLLKGDGICTSAIIVKRTVAEQVPFDEQLESFQDFDYLLRLARSFKGKVQKEVLLDYQISPLGISRNPVKKVNGLARIIEKFAEQYIQLNYQYSLAELYQKQGDFTLLKGDYLKGIVRYCRALRLAPFCLKGWVKLFAAVVSGKYILQNVIQKKQILQWQKVQQDQ